MKTFEVQFRYQNRDDQTIESTVKVDASNLPGGVARLQGKRERGRLYRRYRRFCGSRARFGPRGHPVSKPRAASW